jgi:hypothetical protein
MTTNTYKLGDTVLLTDSDEIGEVATIINIASDSYELEFQDGECGWYAHHESRDIVTAGRGEGGFRQYSRTASHDANSCTHAQYDICDPKQYD